MPIKISKLLSILLILSCTQFALLQGSFFRKGLEKGSSSMGGSSHFDDYAGILSTDDYTIPNIDIHENHGHAGGLSTDDCTISHIDVHDNHGHAGDLSIDDFQISDFEIREDTSNDVTEGIQIEDDDGSIPITKKPSKASCTDIYANQPRSLFDREAEGTLRPFMIELNQFFETEMKASGYTSDNDMFLKREMELLTHEFLLMSIKAHLTYFSNPHNLESTLKAVYTWLLEIWRTIPVETANRRGCRKACRRAIEVKNAYAPDTTEYAISLLLLNPDLVRYSQRRLSAYVVLSWMNKFRPDWYKFFIKLSGTTMPEYKSSQRFTNEFNACIEKIFPRS